MASLMTLTAETVQGTEGNNMESVGDIGIYYNFVFTGNIC